MGAGLTEAYKQDSVIRIADNEVNPENIGIETHEFAEDGVVLDQNGVRVTMFAVDHDPADAIVPAVGYRVDYNGNSVLISGDTRPSDNLVHHAMGVNLLIHEVADFPDPNLPVIQAVYAHHTNPQQAGEIFTETQPNLAVYSHIVNGVPPNVPTLPVETIVERTRETYDGPLVVGEDRMSFTIADGEVTQNPAPGRMIHRPKEPELSYETFDVAVEGGNLRVGRWGTGAEVILAAHGITGNHLHFGNFAAQLGPDFTLVAPDLRGRGRSSKISGAVLDGSACRRSRCGPGLSGNRACHAYRPLHGRLRRGRLR